MTTILYAIKCDEGYIKAEEDGLKIVGMQKASVFKNIQDMLSIMEIASDIKEIHAVELTITERVIWIPECCTSS